MNIKESALVLIDLQKESDFGLLGMDKVIDNTKQLISACRNAGIPIIYTRQLNRADGVGLSVGEPLNDDGTPFYYNTANEKYEILDEIKPAEQDIVIDKYRWSAFYETSLDVMLKGLGVKDLIIGGVVTDGCLMTSVFDAYFRDYNVHLIKDICTTSNEGAHMASLMIMSNWVYNLKVYDTVNMEKRLLGKEFKFYQSDKVDNLQFNPENMREMYSQLERLQKEE